MARLVALLGSINVGGNRLKMADLRAALEAAGFANVATITASGNVLFDDNGAGEAAVSRQIEDLLRERFAISSFVALRNRAELAAAIADNPFAADGEAKFVHTVFLENPIDQRRFEAFADGYAGPERIALGARMLFADYAHGVARSLLDPAMKKAKLIEGRATARNISSLRRILAAMEG